MSASPAVVVDSSVVVRWLLEGSDAAEAALHTGAAAPMLLLAEVSNALVTQVRFAGLPLDAALGLCRGALALAVELVPDRELLTDALAVAAELGLSAYDALYVALAAGRDLPLLTADRRLAASYHGATLVA